MYIEDLHDVCDESSNEEARKQLSDRTRERIKDAVGEIIDEKYDELEDNAGYFITTTAANRAEKFLLRVLHGDEDAANVLLGGESDRYKMSGGYDDGEPWAEMHHGKNLFETSGVELRRKIVEANRDLLMNEVIADRDATIDGLKKQIGEMHNEIERLRERIRYE